MNGISDMDENPKKCLVHWHEYSDSVTVAVQTLRYDQELFDVTLACEGQTIRAHKLVLAASSQYFRQVLKDFPCEHPTIVIDGVGWDDLVALLQFMYYGQVLVEEKAVLPLLMAASSLAVIGLSYVTAALRNSLLTPEPASQNDQGVEAEDKCAHSDLPKDISLLPLSNGIDSSEGAVTEPLTSKDKSYVSSSSCKDTLNSTTHSPSSNRLRSLEPNINSVKNAQKTSNARQELQIYHKLRDQIMQKSPTTLKGGNPEAQNQLIRKTRPEAYLESQRKTDIDFQNLKKHPGHDFKPLKNPEQDFQNLKHTKQDFQPLRKTSERDFQLLKRPLEREFQELKKPSELNSQELKRPSELQMHLETLNHSDLDIQHPKRPSELEFYLKKSQQKPELESHFQAHEKPMDLELSNHSLKKAYDQDSHIQSFGKRSEQDVEIYPSRKINQVQSNRYSELEFHLQSLRKQPDLEVHLQSLKKLYNQNNNIQSITEPLDKEIQYEHLQKTLNQDAQNELLRKNSNHNVEIEPLRKKQDVQFEPIRNHSNLDVQTEFLRKQSNQDVQFEPIRKYSNLQNESLGNPTTQNHPNELRNPSNLDFQIEPVTNPSNRGTPTPRNPSDQVLQIEPLRKLLEQDAQVEPRINNVDQEAQIQPLRRASEQESYNQQHHKRLKTGSENNPPDLREKVYRLDPALEEIPQRLRQDTQNQGDGAKGPKGGDGAKGPQLSFLGDNSEDQEEERDPYCREKILSERKLNEENFLPDEGPGPGSPPFLNGDSAGAGTKHPLEGRDFLSNELSQDSASPEGADLDLGPAPLPLNHPAVLAASSSMAAAVSYAALFAANRTGSSTPPGVGSGGSNVQAPSAVTLPPWVPPMSNASPCPSPPAQGGFVHPPGMSQQDLQATLEQYQRKLAFHEPRPCPTCKRVYRDAATLRTHIAIMHSEGKEPFGCTCGALFRTKYDMYQHKKNGHR